MFKIVFKFPEILATRVSLGISNIVSLVAVAVVVFVVEIAVSCSPGCP